MCMEKCVSKIQLRDTKAKYMHTPYSSKVCKNYSYITKSTMVGENFEICWPQVARNVFKLSTMVGEKFEICWPQMARNVLKLSSMVG